jgi:hypothetical protein
MEQSLRSFLRTDTHRITELISSEALYEAHDRTKTPPAPTPKFISRLASNGTNETQGHPRAHLLGYEDPRASNSLIASLLLSVFKLVCNFAPPIIIGQMANSRSQARSYLKISRPRPPTEIITSRCQSTYLNFSDFAGSLT